MTTKKVDAERGKAQRDAQSDKDEAMKSWQKLYPDLLKAISFGGKAEGDKAYEAARVWKERYLNILEALDAKFKVKMKEEVDLLLDKAALLKAATKMKGPFSDFGKNVAAATKAFDMLDRAFDTKDKPTIDVAAKKVISVLGRLLQDSINVGPLPASSIPLDIKKFSPDDYNNTLARGFRPIDIVQWSKRRVTFWRQDENCYGVTGATPKYSLTWKQLAILASTERTWSIGPFVMRHADLDKLLRLKDTSYTNAEEAKVVEKIIST